MLQQIMQRMGRFTLAFFLTSLISLASPSSWQKLDLLALSFRTVTSRRGGTVGRGGGGGGGGGGGLSSGGDGWASCLRFIQASRLAASRAWRPGPR